MKPTTLTICPPPHSPPSSVPTFPEPVEPATANILPFSRYRLMFFRTGVTYRLVKKTLASSFGWLLALFSCLIFSKSSPMPWKGKERGRKWEGLFSLCVWGQCLFSTRCLLAGHGQNTVTESSKTRASDHFCYALDQHSYMVRFLLVKPLTSTNSYLDYVTHMQSVMGRGPPSSIHHIEHSGKTGIESWM